MNPRTRLALNAINRGFYSAEASSASFSKTRDHPWPGWERAWSATQDAARRSVLDAGCGNGRFAEFLAARCSAAIH